jgi:tRNA-specific 2-thiouridylase
MIKFGALADRLGDQHQFMASGHYARVERLRGRARLLRSVDAHKDQTYFLSQMRQDQVARCVFPIGGLLKSEVRKLARRYGLPTADRPDSQGLCFLGRVPFDDFVRHHLGDEPGEIHDIRSGEVLGLHRGLWFYTIGQRQGLGLAGGPWYVVDKDRERRRLLVVHGRHLAAHARSRFIVPEPHWIADPPAGSDLLVKLRHGPKTVRCSITPTVDDGLAVDLEDQTDPGIAPGQFAVFYDGDECLGGGAMAWPAGAL